MQDGRTAGPQDGTTGAYEPRRSHGTTSGRHLLRRPRQAGTTSASAPKTTMKTKKTKKTKTKTPKKKTTKKTSPTKTTTKTEPQTYEAPAIPTG